MRKVNVLILAALFCQTLCSQNDTVAVKSSLVIYSFFFNIVPDQFKLPLIGFVNVATGNYQGVQAGFVNTTLRNTGGVQAGFVNTTLRNTGGVQVGFVNTTLGDLKGASIGFVNTAKQAEGFQLGFVNTAAKGMSGVQLGFLNYADTLTKGAPIGFLSIVRRGGYRAIEISTNELYPANVTFKIGIPHLYTYIQGGYNPDSEKTFAWGAGFGSLCPIGKKLFFNPEIGSLNPIGKNVQQQMLSLVGNFRYELFPAVQIAVGPSLVWMSFSKGEDLYSPNYSLATHTIDNHNRLLVGLRAALSINL